MGPRKPKRLTMAAETPTEQAAISTLEGRKARPTCKAL